MSSRYAGPLCPNCKTEMAFNEGWQCIAKRCPPTPEAIRAAVERIDDKANEIRLRSDRIAISISIITELLKGGNE